MSNMTQKVPGGPAPQSVADMGTQAKAASAVGDKAFIYNNSRNTFENNFPVVPFPQDNYDQTISIKNEFANINNSNWVVPFTEKEAEYVARKRDADEQSQYDQWVYQKYDLSDPAQLYLFQQMCPSQFERREELIKYQVALANRYANIRLRGAKNEDDLKFEWLVETKRIVLPNTIWDPSQGMKEGNERRDQYRAARFSVLKWISRENQNLGWRANPDNMSDPRGVPGTTYRHFGLETPNYNDRVIAQGLFGRRFDAGNLPVGNVDENNNVANNQPGVR